VDDWDAVAEYVFANRKYFAGVAFMSESGDRAYYQAPNTKIIPAKQIVKEYGTGAVFASGLIVDGVKVFDNLWVACSAVHDEEPSQEDAVGTMKRDWIRRFRKFADNYFDCNLVTAELCLKDVHLLHQWEKIAQNLTDIDWVAELKEKRFTDIDTMGAAACVGTKETAGEPGCML
jgi:ribonucleoside-triphosphate reductase